MHTCTEGWTETRLRYYISQTLKPNTLCTCIQCHFLVSCLKPCSSALEPSHLKNHKLILLWYAIHNQKWFAVTFLVCQAVHQTSGLKVILVGGLGFAPQFRSKVARVRIWIKGSWRLRFGIWVLYLNRMSNITYQVHGVDLPLTLSEKIGGHVTWVICYQPPMEIMQIFRIADA